MCLSFLRWYIYLCSQWTGQVFTLLDVTQLVAKYSVVLQNLTNFPNKSNSHIIFRILIDAYYQKQNKTRKSRGLEMLSDIEKLGIMVSGNHLNPREGMRV